MRRRWLSDLKAMGQGSSPSLNLRRKSLIIEKVALALSETSLETPPLSNSQISRIEAKIFERTFQEAPSTSHPSLDPDGKGTLLKQTRPKVEGPVPREVFARNQLHLTRDFSPAGSLTTIDISSEPGVSEETETFQSTPVTGKPKRRAVRFAAAGLCATYLLSATLAAASQDARAGQMLYPVKLQVEAIRLALGGAEADKARIYMSIAADRLAILRTLGTMDPGDISITAGEMDGAGLHALKLAQRAPSKQRSDLFADLLALAEQEQRVLETLIAHPAQRAIDSLSQSYEVARHIELVALRMLIPTGTIPKSEADFETGPVQVPPTSEVAPSRGEKLSQNIGTPQKHAPDIAPPPNTEPAGEKKTAEPGPDPDQGCAAESGEICIILPIQLPGGIPSES